MQMIDFVLQDARVPSRSLNDARCASLILALHSHLRRARHNRGEAGHAEASLEELRSARGLQFRWVQHWVNDDMERKRLALALGDLFGGQAGQVLLLVFDDGAEERRVAP